MQSPNRKDFLLGHGFHQLLLILVHMLATKIAWFQISATSDICWQYRIRFWDTQYNINPLISADVGADIDDIDKKPLADINTKILKHAKLYIITHNGEPIN